MLSFKRGCRHILLGIVQSLMNLIIIMICELSLILLPFSDDTSLSIGPN